MVHLLFEFGLEIYFAVYIIPTHETSPLFMYVSSGHFAHYALESQNETDWWWGSEVFHVNWGRSDSTPKIFQE